MEFTLTIADLFVSNPESYIAVRQIAVKIYMYYVILGNKIDWMIAAVSVLYITVILPITNDNSIPSVTFVPNKLNLLAHKSIVNKKILHSYMFFYCYFIITNKN